MSVSLDGKTAIVTGSNTGIGKETARELARMGARVIMACRTESKARDAMAEIGGDVKGADLDFHRLDLSSFAHIQQGAQELLDRDEPVHILVNNAGLAGVRGQTSDGFEMQFGVNHMGTFLWTMLLLDRIKENGPGRIVNVASQAHFKAKDLDLNIVRRPTKSLLSFREYAVSKLANVLFTRRLARELDGTGVSTYAVHPGVIASDIWRKIPQPARWLVTRNMKSNAEGAVSSIRCASDPSLADLTGRYYHEDGEEREASKLGTDDALADALWEYSLEAVDGYLA